MYDEDEVITIEELIDERKPSKWDLFKQDFKEKKQKFFDWIGKQSLTELITALTAIFGLVAMIFKTFKPTAEDKARKRIDYSYYDPSTGIRWELKRKLNGLEKEELDYRRRNGEPVGEILRDLGVYKR